MFSFFVGELCPNIPENFNEDEDENKVKFCFTEIVILSYLNDYSICAFVLYGDTVFKGRENIGKICMPLLIQKMNFFIQFHFINHSL